MSANLFYFIRFCFLYCFIILWGAIFLYAQETDLGSNEENINIQQEQETEQNLIPINNYNFLNLYNYTQNPLFLNEIKPQTLAMFTFISVLQQKSFFEYIKKNGQIIDINELERIPHWDQKTITQLLPYLILKKTKDEEKKIEKNFLILQTNYYLRQHIAFTLPDSNKNKFNGLPLDYFIKYQFVNKIFHVGVSTTQHAGETGSNELGSDFLSWHFKANIPKGFLKNIFLGDYTVQLGQGLIEWQGFGFNKPLEVLDVQKNAPVFLPYHGTTGFNFKRGIAGHLELLKLNINPFFSIKNMDGVIDSNQHIRSLRYTNYHRNWNEKKHQNTIREISYGINLNYLFKDWEIGINWVAYQFNEHMESDLFYKTTFTYPEKIFNNSSFYWKGELFSIEFWGEFAKDKNNQFSFISGIRKSFNKWIDLCFVYRNYSSLYQSFYSNSLRENSLTLNEKSVYAAALLIPNKNLQLSYSLDLVTFPWYTYSSHSPTIFTAHFLKLTKYFDKLFEFNFLATFRNKTFADYSNQESFLQIQSREDRNRFRTMLKYNLSPLSFFQSQIDFSLYENNLKTTTTGFVLSNDWQYQNEHKNKIQVNARLQFFDIPSTNNSVLFFEKDVKKDFAFTYLAGKGIRYYINFHYSLLKQIIFSLKWGHTIYSEITNSTNNYSSILGDDKMNLKAQIIINF